jgi:hypothetical protein
MMLVLSMQWLISFFYFACVGDIIIGGNYTAWEIVGMTCLIAWNFGHAVWIVFRLPQFHHHTAHTRHVERIHPTAHPDFLHPEHTREFQDRIARVRERRLANEQQSQSNADESHGIKLTVRDDPSLDSGRDVDHVGWNPFDAAVRVTGGSSEQQQQPQQQQPQQRQQTQPLRIEDHRPLLHASTWSPVLPANIMKPSMVMAHMIVSHRDVPHMDTNRCCCCISIPLRSITLEEESQWIDHYLYVNSVVFLTGLMLDLVINYRAKSTALWALVLTINSMRLIALRECAPLRGSTPPLTPKGREHPLTPGGHTSTDEEQSDISNQNESNTSTDALMSPPVSITMDPTGSHVHHHHAWDEEVYISVHWFHAKSFALLPFAFMAVVLALLATTSAVATVDVGMTVLFVLASAHTTQRLRTAPFFWTLAIFFALIVQYVLPFSLVRCTLAWIALCLVACFL